MTAVSTDIIETLNDLIRINNDRIEAYRLALIKLPGSEEILSNLFNKMVNESLKNNKVLSREVDIMEGDVEEGTSIEGKIYRAWVNLKTIFTGNSTHHILGSCEVNEDATLDAYRTAMLTDDMADYLREIISDQLDELLHSHDQIKNLRDRTSEVNFKTY